MKKEETGKKRHSKDVVTIGRNIRIIVAERAYEYFDGDLKKVAEFMQEPVPNVKKLLDIK